MRKLIALACLTALVAAGVGTASAAGLFTGKDIKNHSIAGKDIKRHSLGFSLLNRKLQRRIRRGTQVGNGNTSQQVVNGPQGPKGPQGVNGVNGVNGSNAAGVVGPHWSIIQRNTEKGGLAQLTNGPFVGAGATGAPPFGQGSLNLQTAGPDSKVAFGNQVDFFGDAVADLDQVGFRVMPTGEDLDRGDINMPSIIFEIDPNNPTGTTTDFSSLVFIPNETTRNQWSGYIDATDESQGSWGLTGGQFNPGGQTTNGRCGINGTRCSWDEVQASLATGDGATILTAGVSKGKDFEFQGSVDGLRINNEVFDFESYGVNPLTP